ncbi:MAG: hypothetical protein LBR33_07930 [Propionibacteriaceae bacterium]|nr:hypothetical protein [Propionibacteriaceae bacterium]
MTVCAVNVVGDQVGGGWGRAHTVAIVTIAAGQISDWTEYEVGWDVLHDAGPHGTHHGRIVRFLLEHHVDLIVTGHMGPPMVNTVNQLGITAVLGAAGPARALVTSVTSEWERAVAAQSEATSPAPSANL